MKKAIKEIIEFNKERLGSVSFTRKSSEVNCYRSWRVIRMFSMGQSL